MTPWLETAGVLMLALLGALSGQWLSRQRRGVWLPAYVLAFAPIIAIAVAKRAATLSFVAPLSWLMWGRTEYVVTSFVAAVALGVLAPRLPRPRDRRAVRGVIVGFTLFLVQPFCLPPFMASSLSALPTYVDPDGVCRQSTGYNCGPAAAVTALRRLGLEGREGELAVATDTTPVDGTQADTLCEVLRDLYARDGLRSEYRTFDSVESLRRAGVVITVINFSLLVDHYVAVLDVGEDEILLGDPLEGARAMPLEEFTRVWRRVGIALERPGWKEGVLRRAE